MQDLFTGTWKLIPARSDFDANHRPKAGTMIMEWTPEGYYTLTAEGVNEKGEKCAERPTKLIPDGVGHPVPGFPGLTAVVSRPDPNTLVSEARREDGSVVGGSNSVVSPDGASMTVTNFGYDTQLRQFQQKTFWERQ